MNIPQHGSQELQHHSLPLQLLDLLLLHLLRSILLSVLMLAALL
jgi:hypothetical protein